MAKTKKRKKKSSAAKNVAIFFIVFVLLEGLLIFGLKSVFRNEDSVASVAGYSFFIMDSDNMGQYCPKDALVITVNGVPSADKCGFTVLAKNVEGQGTTVGRLYEVGAKGDTVDYVVYTIYQEKDYDAQNDKLNKSYDLKSTDIIGQATSYYLTAGKIISFMTTPFGIAVCLAAPIVLMILILLIISIANRSESYDLHDFEEMERKHDAQQNNMSLDDFLYGGENDEVYNNEGKPSADYSEEFDEQEENDDPISRIAPQADAFFGSQSAPEEDDEHDPEDDFKEATEFDEPEKPAPVVDDDDDTPYIPKELFRKKTPEPQPPEPVIEKENAEPEQEIEVQEEAKPTVDPSYYEKASKVIDDAVSTQPEAVETAAPVAAPVEEEPVQRPQRPRRPAQAQGQGQRRRPSQRPAGAPARRRPPRPARPVKVDSKSSADTIDELMKLMEEEQKKLRSANEHKE